MPRLACSKDWTGHVSLCLVRAMMPDVPAGESLQEIGRDGVRSVPRCGWKKLAVCTCSLTGMTLVKPLFLGFKKLSGQEFSFDMSGVLRLDTGNVQFFGEVKEVSGEASQGVMYPEYLAKCYRDRVPPDPLPFYVDHLAPL